LVRFNDAVAIPAEHAETGRETTTPEPCIWLGPEIVIPSAVLSTISTYVVKHEEREGTLSAARAAWRVAAVSLKRCRPVA